MADTANASTASSPSSSSDAAKRAPQADAVAKALAETPARSTGSIELGGQRLAYRVEAGFTPVLCDTHGDRLGEPEAAIFTTAYLLDGAEAARRPVCFAFNGGPGSASIFLHLGALGPKRMRVNDDGSMPAPPYAVEDNPQSWFEHADLVFIDPPHTGYSLTANDEARKKAFSVDGDVALLCEVMKAWLTRHQRWGSPIYLCGESYGTTRACAMADRLCSQGLPLAGLVLVSCAMDIQALEFSPRNDLPYGLFLPAFAGVAQYHGCLTGSLGASGQAARAAAAEFVETEYLAALHRGGRLTGAERSRVARRIGELIGLPAALVEQHNLRISDTAFFAELLRDRGLAVGRLDARATAPLGLHRSREFEFDPGLEPLVGPYTMAAMAYFGGTLGLPPGRNFETMSEQAHKHWNWNRGEANGNGYACTSPDLARVMRRLPHLKVFVASGLYDLGTPYSATEWTLDQLEIPDALRSRIQHRLYGAGHMMYTRQADLEQLKADVAAWFAGVNPGQ